MADAAETIAVPRWSAKGADGDFRPAGTGDVGYRMIARPLLQRLDASGGRWTWWFGARERSRPCGKAL